MFYFLYPQAWLLLLLLPWFLFLETKFHTWQNQQQTVFAESAFHGLLRLRHPRRAGNWAFWFCIWGALVMALARPVWVSASARRGGVPGFSLYLVLDTSLSMQAEDAFPTRLRAAKKFFHQLAAALPETSLGLIVFEGEAQVACPPTRDRAALGQALENARTRVLAHKGSEMESALNLALAKISAHPAERPAALVVASDGEQNQPGNPVAAAARLAAQKIPIFCLGVGTPEGANIPLGRDFWGKPMVRMHHGERVLTRLQPEILQRLAWTGQGQYLPLAGDPEVPLARLLAALKNHPWLVPAAGRGSGLPLHRTGERELYPWGILIAVLVWLLREILLARRERQAA